MFEISRPKPVHFRPRILNRSHWSNECDFLEQVSYTVKYAIMHIINEF